MGRSGGLCIVYPIVPTLSNTNMAGQLRDKGEIRDRGLIYRSHGVIEEGRAQQQGEREDASIVLGVRLDAPDTLLCVV